MLEHARKYRSRMFKASNIYTDLFQTLNQVVPALSKAIAGKKASKEEMGQALKEIQHQIDKLNKVYQRLSDNLIIDEDILGRLQEDQEIGSELAQELSRLATLSQYVEVAAQSSANFNRDILGLVELPVFEEALRGLNRERLDDIVGVVDRVRGNGR